MFIFDGIFVPLHEIYKQRTTLKTSNALILDVFIVQNDKKGSNKRIIQLQHIV